jgi:hypothetical protein
MISTTFLALVNSKRLITSYRRHWQPEIPLEGSGAIIFRASSTSITDQLTEYEQERRQLYLDELYIAGSTETAFIV